MMNLNNVPYLVLHRRLDFGFSVELVHVALCLMDHELAGVGCSEAEAIGKMFDELRAKYPPGRNFKLGPRIREQGDHL